MDLQDGEKDMIVMYHKFGYELDGEKKQIDSTMVCLGDGKMQTAMAKTVGLPVAIAALKILNGEITTPGVQIPITAPIYEPILKELEDYGIRFHESEMEYLGYNPISL
ncbi:saccharopine dehydrogenase [Nonlabens ulvanivorans]|nr:saccharopine dehydrogenase [Nonlabens ulvanivorans]